MKVPRDVYLAEAANFSKSYTLCTVMEWVKIDSVTRTVAHPEGGLPNSKNST